MPLHPMDTNRRDYARAEEGMAISRGLTGLCAPSLFWPPLSGEHPPVLGQHHHELPSPTTLTPESQSGSGFACSTITIVVIRAKSRNLWITFRTRVMDIKETVKRLPLPGVNIPSAFPRGVTVRKIYSPQVRAEADENIPHEFYCRA